MSTFHVRLVAEVVSKVFNCAPKKSVQIPKKVFETLSDLLPGQRVDHL